jgi:hypothetical protein
MLAKFMALDGPPNGGDMAVPQAQHGVKPRPMCCSMRLKQVTTPNPGPAHDQTCLYGVNSFEVLSMTDVTESLQARRSTNVRTHSDFR